MSAHESHESIERKTDHSAHAPTGDYSPAGAPDVGTGAQFAADSSKVLARMPDLGSTDSRMIPERSRRHQSSRQPSLAPTGKLLWGATVAALLVAVAIYAVNRKDASDTAPTDESTTWQPEAPAPTAPTAPAWGGATGDGSNWQAQTGSGAYGQWDGSQAPARNGPAQPGNWGGPPQSGNWGQSAYPQPRADTTQAQPWRDATPSQPWGQASEPSGRAAQPEAAGMGAQPQWGGVNEPNVTYWGNADTQAQAALPPIRTGQDAAPTWTNQAQTPSWQNPPYGTPPRQMQSPDASRGNTVQSPSAYAGPDPRQQDNRYQGSQTGPSRSMPTGIRDPRQNPSYDGRYRSYSSSAAPGADPTMDPAAVAQRNGYQTGPTQANPTDYQRGYSGQYRSQGVGSRYGQQPQINNPNSYRSGYPAGYPTAYPSTDSPRGGTFTIPSSGAGASIRYPQPGVATLDGMIEKPTARATYDRAGSSLY